nr:hypothetical protein [Bacillus velezensis]
MQIILQRAAKKTSVEKDRPLHHGENHTALTYLTPHWRQKVAAWDPNCGNKKKRTCLLFQYDRELFHFMRENAENGFENTQIILVLSGNRFSYHGDGVYEIDHREEAHFDRLRADLKKRGQMPDTVVYGWPEGSFAGPEKISEQLSKGAYPLFFFSRALMRKARRKKRLYRFSFIRRTIKMISRFTLQSMAQGSLFCLRTRNWPLRQSGYQFQTSHRCRNLQLKSSESNLRKRIREKPIFIMKEMCAGSVPYGKRNRLKTQVSPLKKTEYT